MNLNLTIFHFLNNLVGRSAVFDWLVTAIGGYGDLVTMVAALGFLAFLILRDEDYDGNGIMRWLKETLTIGCSVVVAWMISYAIKTLAHIPRPFVTFPMIHTLLTETPYDSFPSGHATVFFALATAIYLRDKTAGVFFFACAILITVCRVIAGIHYPADIIAGAALGIGVALIIDGLMFQSHQKFR